jgi:hypothetical protein
MTISQSDYNRKRQRVIQSYGGYKANREVLRKNGWTNQEADAYLNDVADAYVQDEFAGRDVNKGLDRVNKKYYNPKLDKIRQQRLSTRKVRSDKGKRRKLFGVFSDMQTLHEFKRGKDKKKRKMRKPNLENHVMTGAKYGAGIGGGLGALSGAAYGTLLAPGVGTVVGGLGYGGLGALGGGLQGAAVSLPVYAYNKHKYQQQSKPKVKKYER